MIVFLRGEIADKQPARIVLDVGGVGYEIFIPLSSYDRLPSVGETCQLSIVDHVREDAHLLFGFATDAEQRMFGLLTGISGIGPKLALSALSGLTVRDLSAAVLDGDVKRLSTIQGVGRKMAERMVIELRDRIDPGEAMRARAGGEGAKVNGQALTDAVMALSALGYSQDQARKMVEKVLALTDPPTAVEAIIKRALSGR